LAALLGLSHLYSLGKRIELVLANSLIHYLSSSLRAQVAFIRSDKPWTDPIRTTPQELRDHPSGPTVMVSPGSQTDHRAHDRWPCTARVGEGPLTRIFLPRCPIRAEIRVAPWRAQYDESCRLCSEGSSCLPSATLRTDGHQQSPYWWLSKSACMKQLLTLWRMSAVRVRLPPAARDLLTYGKAYQGKTVGGC
jgi:hypothetical protein